ncbi:hypothetical protein MIND_00835100 [Mycena indigotica]|uniref:C2H2-type domain-containing protein n=1 Tax=Mycena indigotica TaxID=2126181 RepID=A0A8H6SIB3_9AGAR|nr:uncharacterized protein MIND_00835100 [Mycena indigotica]KAF7298872.1 hypothetical protein MIND_00835100 [Mycena indigotica]
MAVPRRQSLAMLYAALRSDEDDPYDIIKEAGDIFEDEDQPFLSRSASTTETGSEFSFSTPSPRFELTRLERDHLHDEETGSDSDSDSDDDSDIEPMNLSSEICVIVDEPGFIPHREQSPEISNHIESGISVEPSRRVKSPPTTRLRVPVFNDEPLSDGESTGDASDDEYMPSPKLIPRKRARSSSPARLPSAPYRAFSDPPAQSTSTESGRPAKRARPPPVSRNRQTTLAEVQQAEASDEYADFKCQVCGWIQHNKRIPDFKRHVKTHQREADDQANRGWCCVGVLVGDARHYSRISRGAEIYTHLGQQRIGGCRKTFSRRDALKRHLENSNLKCVSEILAPTEE